MSKETLAKNNNLSKKQVHEMQTNVANIVTANETLNVDLQTASKTIVRKNILNYLIHDLISFKKKICRILIFIQNQYFFLVQVELEIKLKAYEKLIACEQATSK